MPKMLQLFSALVAAGLIQAILAVPAPQASYAENNEEQAGVFTPIPTATAISGSLYGPQSLLGEIAPPTPTTDDGENSAIVSNYPLVNGQGADSDLGLFLDFNSVENPQPLRGSGGGTQPGPSMFEPAFLLLQ